MGVFFQYALASLLLAVALVYIYDHTIGQVVNRVTNTAARVGVFVGAWTAVTSLLGMRGFSKAVHTLRQKTKGVNNEIGPPPKDVRIR